MFAKEVLKLVVVKLTVIVSLSHICVSVVVLSLH